MKHFINDEIQKFINYTFIKYQKGVKWKEIHVVGRDRYKYLDLDI